MDNVNYFINVYSFSLSYPMTCTVDDFAKWHLDKCMLFKWIALVVILSCGCVIYFTSSTYNYLKIKCKFAH